MIFSFKFVMFWPTLPHVVIDSYMKMKNASKSLMKQKG